MNGGISQSAGRLSYFTRVPLIGRRPSRTLTVRTFASEGSRQGWDFGRFVKTVLFFNDPFKNILKAFAAPAAETPQPVVEKAASGVVKVFGPMDTTAAPVLLLGSETLVGRCILEGMVKSGMFVRAVVSDIQKAQTAFETMERNVRSTLEVVEWKQSTTEMPPFEEGRPIIVCDALSPYQTLLTNMFKGEKDVYNPSKGVESMTWGPLDDVVMGGCSQSQLSIQKGKGDTSEYAAVFSGNITSANNGGFASVRTKNFEPALDLSTYDGLKIRLKGDGQRYKFMLRTTEDWDSVSYCKSFDTQQGWQDVELPFKDFFPVFRARSVTPPPALSLNKISSLQVMLSKFEYDGDLNPSVKMGRFELPIESIKTYSDQSKNARVVLIDGSKEDQMNLKSMAAKYSIVESDPTQTVDIKDSTFVSFCIACLTEDAALNMTFKEKMRKPLQAELSFDQLLENFSTE